MNDEYIKGAFLGALVVCLLMLNFPKERTCAVTITRGNISHVTVGDWH